MTCEMMVVVMPIVVAAAILAQVMRLVIVKVVRVSLQGQAEVVRL